LLHLIQYFQSYQDYLADLLILCFQVTQPVPFFQEFHQFQECLLVLVHLSNPEVLELHHVLDHQADLEVLNYLNLARLSDQEVQASQQSQSHLLVLEVQAILTSLVDQEFQVLQQVLSNQVNRQHLLDLLTLLSSFPVLEEVKFQVHPFVQVGHPVH